MRHEIPKAKATIKQSVCVKLASNALPSPDNLSRWGKRVMATCPLCSCPNGTLAHIINFCLGHTADIKCMSVHPNKLLIATGQASSALERPHVRIWNSVSLQKVHTLGLADFEHNICCVSLSKADGGNLLVAVEESEHTISVSYHLNQELRNKQHQNQKMV